MGLNHSFKTARKKIVALDADEREVVMAICRDIYQAQVRLTENARPILERCMSNCRGLCCRNIHPADIITEWDLLYILVMAPQMEEAMAACLKRERFFPSDCIFLENGTGPCLFPDNLRPERCIISFCRVEPSVEKEIGRVMGGFSRLIRFFLFRPLRRLSRWLRPLNSAREP
ncbi:MAG: hypothetical protein HGJ94_10975 [Desulfosarcina sp.]|nr:hypothetical protein [Desulfosarcina sp.]MBC2744416.1 hypothetical protein [Desulfosarcina sp.]MBC2767324.1 hypothetical protein [Desulfosarcina sp.]